MKVEIQTARVAFIMNLDADGSVFGMKEDPQEHVRVPFVDALRAYCDAVDHGAEYFTVREGS